MNRREYCELAVKRLNDDPRNTSLLKHIIAYIEELETDVSELHRFINSRSNEDNFVKAGELIESQIDEFILQTFESL